MDKQHDYKLFTKWTGNTGNGTSNVKTYERSYIISINNKVDISGTSDTAFNGDKTKHNPEELFVAALSACHMLWYLFLCAEAGIIVIEYIDDATGTMLETANGGGHFTEVTLHPRIVVAERTMINKAMELHSKANKMCYIANSCNFPILHEPKVDAVKP